MWRTGCVAVSQYLVISPDPTVKSLLAKRGFRLIGQGDDSKLLIPKVGDLTADGEFHDFYGDYTFRKILRHLVAKGGSAHIADLKSICAETKLQDFHDFLTRSQLIRTGSDDSWELEVNVDSWGYTVEWYVSRLMSDKLDSISQWGVKIDGLYAGGDYDVLSCVLTS